MSGPTEKSVESRLRELLRRRSDLKDAKDYRGAIPVQIEIIGLLEKGRSPQPQLMRAHNHASVLYLQSALYNAAEHHARIALRMVGSQTAKDLESRGCYHWALAQILAAQSRFDEAVIFAENAVRDYGSSGFHAPPDEFLSRICFETDRMRNGTWSPPQD